jgi:hypothetical protein
MGRVVAKSPAEALDKICQKIGGSPASLVVYFVNEHFHGSDWVFEYIAELEGNESCLLSVTNMKCLKE